MSEYKYFVIGGYRVGEFLFYTRNGSDMKGEVGCEVYLRGAKVDN